MVPRMRAQSRGLLKSCARRPAWGACRAVRRILWGWLQSRVAGVSETRSQSQGQRAVASASRGSLQAVGL